MFSLSHNRAKVRDFFIISGWKEGVEGLEEGERGKRLALGKSLILEEFMEYKEGKDLIDKLDALCDLEYVVHFASLLWGVDGEKYLPEFAGGDGIEWRNPAGKIFEIAAFAEPCRGEGEEEGKAEPFEGREWGDWECNENMLGWTLAWIWYVARHEIACDKDVLGRAFELVHQSNMTKFPSSREVAEARAAEYTEEGKYGHVACRQCEGRWVVYVDEPGEKYGKILKAKDYIDAHTLFRADEKVGEFLMRG